MSHFDRAASDFEAAHQEDPRHVTVDGAELPFSLRYHRRLAHWVDRLQPGASEALRLAAHCQHIRRWTIPRTRYPEGVAGYKKWRTTLALFHGDEAARLLAGAGYDDTTIQRVRHLLVKKGLKKDPEVQVFEDAICLVFLENELADFAKKHDEAKLIDILRKTWDKMSPLGHAAAVELAGSLPPDLRRIVETAVGRSP